MEIPKYKPRNKKPAIDLGNMVFGKVPPQSKDLEKAVLGAILLQKNCFDVVTDILQPESFYIEAHQRVYRAMIKLAEKNQPIDLMMVVEQLQSTEELETIGGPFFIAQLTNAVVSTANIEAHARIVAQKFIAREVIRIGGEMIAQGYDDTIDVFDLQDFADSSVSKLIQGNGTKEMVPLSTGIVKSIQRIEELRVADSHMTGVTSGFKDLDKITHGWQNTDLIILAARPSAGKTAFAGNLAINAAYEFVGSKKSVAFFSLEMSMGQLNERIISAETDVKLDNIKSGYISPDEMKHIYATCEKRISKLPLFIDDTAALNIFELRAKCRRLKNKHNLGFVVIDYLQLMTGTNENKNSNREQEISKISRDLKCLAKELQVPILALSQLSREVEKRKEKTPILSDLRESGAIEQDADMVMFLYRPEYYGENTNEMGDSNAGQTFIKIAKHRNGSLETVELRADLSIQRFFDKEESYSPKIPVKTNFSFVGRRMDSKDEDNPF